MFIQVVVLFSLAASAYCSPISGRIVNGTDAKEGEIPYIVSLRVLRNHNCGASILDATHLLTAGHCVLGYNATLLSIQYGITTIDSAENGENVIQVAKTVINPYFVPGTSYKNDLAIITLEKPIIFGKNVQPVSLVRAFNATPEHQEALLSGWGTPMSGGAVMKNLQKVNIFVYSDDDCERIHAATGTDRRYHICAGVPEGGKGQCNGDSGGPLVVDGHQIGIVSWSVKPCTVQGYPGVFAKVATHVPWILQELKH